MDIYMKVYKYYNLGTTLRKKEIMKNLKESGIKYMGTYDFDDNLENPSFVSYPEPIEFTYDCKEKEKEVTAKVYDYGAMSMMYEVKYEVNSLEEFHEEIKKYDPRPQIEQDFDEIYQKISDKFEGLNDNILSKFNHLYSVYCIDNKGNIDKKELLENNEKIIVSLLSDEYQDINFSQQQKEAVMRYSNSFLKNDYIVVHWNNAFILDNKENYTEKLFIIELANIQFNKLQTYDSFIDDYLSEYLLSNNKSILRFIPFIKSGMSKKVKEIADLRVELERVIDVMDNFEKFQGQWYLARLYYLANSAFQINRWKNLVENRIKKVNELYNLINSEINRKRMLFLNILMLLLFVLWFLGI
ncbi:MAG TPA: hypothetical protein VJ907_08505 [Halanaerobiales bacterium]|nr:hypothetical protein [Halanaerobiales bacterium]